VLLEEIAVAANAAFWGVTNPFRSGDGDRRQAMQWQRHKARNNGEPGKRAMAAGLPSGAALRQVWGCKVAAQPMVQTTERRTYSRPKEAPLFSCGQAQGGGSSCVADLVAPRTTSNLEVKAEA
jgi:hypothetical protein